MVNSVSLWLGIFTNLDEVEKYTVIKYTEDGDSIPSEFEKEFKLGYYDRDLVEKDWISDAEDSIRELLIDFSYDEQLISQFEKEDLKFKYNTIILIYNYNYSKQSNVIPLVENKNYRLDYIGDAVYKDE